MISGSLNCFKAYDVRGKLGDDFNEEICARIARSFAIEVNARKIVVGFDARETSNLFSKVIHDALISDGVDVLTLGLCGTEEVYSATNEFNACGGIMITASHNPIDYNGLKIIKANCYPLLTEELERIKSRAEKGHFVRGKIKGQSINMEERARSLYVSRLISFISLREVKPMKITINGGNGAVGPTFDQLEQELRKQDIELDFHKIFMTPDSSFPNGIPNPLLEENRRITSYETKNSKSDFGVAFDGDFDRCFFFDEDGLFIEGEYIVGLIAESLLKKNPGEMVIHDPRVIWNTQKVVRQNKGIPVLSKTGHAFFKQKMRDKNAIYGGELSAHHYFRDFAYCDSGMIPWLVITELISKKNEGLSALVASYKKLFPSSGEVNFHVENADQAFDRITSYYKQSANDIDYLDGVSITFENWRLNLRKSNTEPLIRLNLESKKDRYLIDRKLDEIKKLLIE